MFVRFLYQLAVRFIFGRFARRFDEYHLGQEEGQSAYLPLLPILISVRQVLVWDEWSASLTLCVGRHSFTITATYGEFPVTSFTFSHFHPTISFNSPDFDDIPF